MSYYPSAPGVISNPSVPFAFPIEGGITAGKLIYINGTVAPYADRFHIDLQNSAAVGDHPTRDIAFHMSIRFGEGCVVRNHFQNNSWGSEERHGGMPFYRGSPFEMIINIEHYAYKVAVNGRHFIEFTHRIAKEIGCFLRVIGDVTIQSVRFQGPMSAAQPMPVVQPMPPAGYPGGAGEPYGLPAPFYNPQTPFNGFIGPLATGRMISIQGTPHYNAKRLHFNLQSGLLPTANIAIHFDARFDHAGDRKVCVRNHREFNTFGNEERSTPYFPFVPNMPFEMIILADHNCFKIAVDGKHFVEFFHRVRPLSTIDSLEVGGDVRLSLIRVQ